MQILHRAAFSPATSTWTQAIDVGYFTTWTGLTSELVRKYLPKLLSTSKGHMRQDRQNICSTKTAVSPTTSLAPDPVEPQSRSHKVFPKTVERTGNFLTDQTGRFCVTSSSGSKYLLVFFYHDRNDILVKPLKSCSAKELGRAYKVLHAHLCDRGLFPLL